jgi:nitrite reductase/ring-hydroxylating ferredoxin subunit
MLGPIHLDAAQQTSDNAARTSMRAKMADGTLSKSAGMTAEGWLTDSWYFACASKTLARGTQFRRIILGQPVLLARTEAGEAFALRDICPHRLVPLSAGQAGDDGRAADDPVPLSWLALRDGWAVQADALAAEARRLRDRQGARAALSAA